MDTEWKSLENMNPSEPNNEKTQAFIIGAFYYFNQMELLTRAIQFVSLSCFITSFKLDPSFEGYKGKEHIGLLEGKSMDVVEACWSLIF